uniref:HydG n=1 Tax=Stygiella incarcerata TaxID=1712417 RepID=A0A192ZJ91_9EUKA|nr:HydG [Stygiella incarcerata]ANM86880.1 HydG [Stygiella incarcerata]|eukprot:TRINITY_DN588_c0_g1_i1.p1 TRINITY_DN588_c0_g1~~TRINITY_DN588_c0_g1_i1.p1  ORF type:complete len:539 (-),score=145.88 TRINITY_DN588_c0_g1_i1:229-1845(-)
MLSRLSSMLSRGAHATSTVLSRTFYHEWSVEREPHHKFAKPEEIINDAELHRALEVTKERAKDPIAVRDILQKAWDNALLKGVVPGEEYVQGLDNEDAAVLLNVDSTNDTLMGELFSTALKIKERIYGNRIVLFAPLYLANYCINSCTYCSFRHENKEGHRDCLSDDEIVEEVKELQQMGHRRLLLLTGESPKYTFDQFLNAVHIVASVRTPPCGSIRRINVEIPSLSVSDFRRLKATNEIGTYTLFQESYHHETYKRVHPKGPKADFGHRLLTMDRAQTGGIDDVGIGALFGLYDYRFEVLGMLSHAKHLDRVYHAGPHTVSIPRMQPAANAPDAERPPYPVDDTNFKKLVAILRCAVPYTGMILSTRESPEMRRSLLHLGVSQMSAGSRTGVGSYHKGESNTDLMNKIPKIEQAVSEEESGEQVAQFTLQDHRTLDEVIHDLLKMKFVPSFCTACYRQGRTGEEFMRIAKKGDIHNFCHPNALLTLQEYLDDYASPETRNVGEHVISEEKEGIPTVRKSFDRKLERVKKGERDLYF